MVTAETITEDQIHALRDEASNLLWDCAIALSQPAFMQPTREQITRARARCAEILNARKSP